MPHLSRLLAAICAITVSLVSLSSDAGIGDKDLPLLNGEKTKLLYTVVGVSGNDSGAATLINCTSTERRGGKQIELGVELFYRDGTSANNVAAGMGAVTVDPGGSVTLATRATLAFFEDEIINTSGLAQLSARILATSKNVLCSAMIVDPGSTPPTSMVMLPVFKATKQGGM